MCKHCWDDPTGPHHKDFIRGGVDVEDFEEVPYRHPPRKKKKEKVKTRPGCPEADFGPHVYVWTDEFIPTNYLFYKFYGFHKEEWNVCCGCGKRVGSRTSQRYRKFKERRWAKYVYRGRYRMSYRYWTWENYDQDYVDYRKDYITKHGFTSMVYGPFYF